MMTAAPRTLSDEWLLDFAAGTTPEPVGVLIASHLALSAAGRRAHAQLEALGGALLDRIAPAALRPDALDRVLARLDEPAAAPAPRPAAPAAGLLPAPLQAYAPGGLDGLSWRRVAEGVAEAELPCADAGGFRLSLMRIAAGRAIPRHTHRGHEMTLVLDGAYGDDFGRYGRGDVEVADETVEHRPVAERGRDCLCLVAQDAPIRLTGPFARLLNPFIRR